MAELHETRMGKTLIDHTLPKIARQLERIANALELKQNINNNYFIDELFSKSLFKPILETKIEDMKLSTRTHNCLQAQGIRTIGELVQKNKTAMLRYRNFGKKCISEIYWKLKLDYGIDKKSFKTDYNPPTDDIDVYLKESMVE